MDCEVCYCYSEKEKEVNIAKESYWSIYQNSSIQKDIRSSKKLILLGRYNEVYSSSKR